MDEKGLSAWLSIVGVGEEGLAGLSMASQAVLKEAVHVIGAKRHLELIPERASPEARRHEWPVPFSEGVGQVLSLRGQRVVMLASGDPFWFGAGSVIVRHLEHGEWQSFPAPSVFSLAASRLGWSLEQTVCLGLHAAPLERLRPHLASGEHLLVLLRDGAAVAALAEWLSGHGFGDSRLHVLEALGGLRERVRQVRAREYRFTDVLHPVTVGIALEATVSDTLACVPGRPDTLFEHDGQISKRPIRALTLSALAPRPGEHLWDIGAGSGSISIEWLLAHSANQATAFEADPQRADRARRNAQALGVDRLKLVTGRAPEILKGYSPPDAVFVGGGLSEALLQTLWQHCLTPGARLVANAVTLESEALLAKWQAACGGHLLRVELAEAAPLGRKRGWKAAYPVVQWSVTR